MLISKNIVRNNNTQKIYIINIFTNNLINNLGGVKWFQYVDICEGVKLRHVLNRSPFLSQVSEYY